MTTHKITTITVEWADGRATHIDKRPDGSWKADGLKALSPSKLLDNLSLWMDLSYEEDEV